METTPLVSIIIPLWNRARLVGETLASCCGQTYQHLEIIVVDDGSSDGSQAVVAEWQGQDDRVALIQRNSLPTGAPACRNLGIQHAKGQFVLFLDSDDLLASSAIESRVSRIQEHPDCDFVVAQGLIFKESPGDMNLLWNRCQYGTDDLLVRFLDQDIPWQTTGPLWRKSFLLAKANWNQNLISFQDWEFHTRMLICGANPVFLDRPDFFVRRSEEERISKRHFEQAHVNARVLAINSIWGLVQQSTSTRRELEQHVRAFLLRNELQLIDAGCGPLYKSFIDSQAGKALISSIDRLMLLWIRRVGPSWHWHSRVGKITRLVWRDLAYDSHQRTGFLATDWHGEITSV